ncbi:hypothetical protein SASPL_144209 [Salvia splendens]|uniref:Homeobox domain-containing protein n=1 Tax=Salvia splendens TaxID=180675 RepID=A0A8X8WMH6_SALSN|nr:homeobox-leucine zipper protein HAT22-like [Salvia splendens]KAG6397748.1 hypothetical protein SASPL_144209 [Salvia splendens]
MDFDDLCNTGLVLGLGNSSSSSSPKNHTKKDDHVRKAAEPSLTLNLSDVKKDDSDLYRQDSAASSFSTVSVKREREVRSEDEDEDGPNGRKKLRLTKAQSALLEESFKQHSTLNPKQKQDLARELKLRPRQVEVWFQNRRARTKLKQTEVDCEFLKKCCETLTDENRRLHKELQELKLAQPLYMQLPAATLTMCPSCERIGGAAADNAAKTSFVTKPHFYNPFTNPSAAC